MAAPTFIRERDSSGRTRRILFGENDMKVTRVTGVKGVPSPLGIRLDQLYILDLLKRIFLPAGYPNTVSPDYLRYQVLNALQAFCNSLAGLLSSRAILQGFGVGDPSATPTQAMLLTVLQDVFGRLTTILSAYFVGSALYPEAKTYRLLADILNDTAVILDTLSPYLNTFKSIPGLRVTALCISAACKSLCGISAGGAKAAITIHFATPITGKGDVGDLNAKDTSKETVLALLGMLLGTLLVPRLTTSWSTHTALFLLVWLHLIINYFGVKGLALRTLNRQRLSIIWMTYQNSNTASPSTSSTLLVNDTTPQVIHVPSPTTVSISERIFDLSGFGTVRDSITGEKLGLCSIGSSFSELIVQHQRAVWIATRLLQIFQTERYLIWFDAGCLSQGLQDIKNTGATGIVIRRTVISSGSLRVHISLKDSYTTQDQLKAWVHAVELCRSVAAEMKGSSIEDIDAIDAIVTAYGTVERHFSSFLDGMESVGWDFVDCALMTGPPASVVVSELEIDSELEDKKSR
ncbi:DUF647-domain-containing protein [Phlegmacium glaucopus]|nr:DUF647-domain-containing protein [Phlegmacium glaucopus]